MPGYNENETTRWTGKARELDVVNIQTPYEIFIYVEGGISDPNLKAG